MARARLLKPGFFKNELLAEMSFEARLCFAGLWTLADKAGRLEDRPKRIAAELFPYDRGVDVDALLVALAEKGFIRRYVVDGLEVIDIPEFLTHQHPHPRKGESDLPAFSELEPSKGVAEPCSPSVSIAVPIAVTDTVPETVTVTEHRAVREEAFARFWTAYPRKVGKDAARKAFERRRPGEDLLARMLDAIALQSQSRQWLKDGGDYIPLPATWLNQGRWQDEIEARPRFVSERTQKLAAASGAMTHQRTIA